MFNSMTVSKTSIFFSLPVDLLFIYKNLLQKLNVWRLKQQKLRSILGCRGSGPLRPLDVPWCVIVVIGAISMIAKTCKFPLACRDHQENGADHDHDTPGHIERPVGPWPVISQNTSPLLLCNLPKYFETYKNSVFNVSWLFEKLSDKKKTFEDSPSGFKSTD